MELSMSLQAVPSSGNSAERLTPADVIQIADAVAGIGLYSDLRDWARVETFFTPQVTADYSSVFGGEVAPVARSALVAQWKKVLPGFDATQHLITNIISVRMEAGAMARSHVRATHWIGDRFWTLGGSYRHDLVMTAEGWLVATMTIERRYEEGDRGLVDQASKRVLASG
jgi:hypothetical protein